MVRELSKNEIKALHYELLLKDIIATAEKLPPFPDVAWKVLPMIRNMAPVSEIESVIRYDQVITAKVIALSQSPYYARRHKVNSLQDAIVLLGGEKLIQIILAACASRYFEGKISGYDLDERELWQHSVSTALMADRIARGLRDKKVLTIYTAALLHDIGKTVLDLYAKIYLHSSLSQIRDQGNGFIDSERRALGIDHQELGEVIARRWRLPQEMTVAIGCHHAPERATSDHRIVEIVYAANQLVSAIEHERSVQRLFDPAPDPVLKKLGIRFEVAQALDVELAVSVEGLWEFLKMR